VVPSYFRLVFQSFFVLPVVVALFGWRKLPDRAARVLIGGLLLMGFVVIAVLQIGKTQLGELPRLIYPTFPAIYLLAALAIDSGVRRLPRASMVASWVLVAAMAVLVNVDIFGYPTLYVEYFVSKPPVFLP
jgi:4-amino-4-deoxy-L-arabinose transferase-like glycosyltransferase